MEKQKKKKKRHNKTPTSYVQINKNKIIKLLEKTYEFRKNGIDDWIS